MAYNKSGDQNFKLNFCKNDNDIHLFYRFIINLNWTENLFVVSSGHVYISMFAHGDACMDMCCPYLIRACGCVCVCVCVHIPPEY